MSVLLWFAALLVNRACSSSRSACCRHGCMGKPPSNQQSVPGQTLVVYSARRHHLFGLIRIHKQVIPHRMHTKSSTSALYSSSCLSLVHPTTAESSECFYSKSEVHKGNRNGDSPSPCQTMISQSNKLWPVCQVLCNLGDGGQIYWSLLKFFLQYQQLQIQKKKKQVCFVPWGQCASSAQIIDFAC